MARGRGGISVGVCSLRSTCVCGPTSYVCTCRCCRVELVACLVDISQLVGGQVTRGWCEEAEAYQCIVMHQIKHHVCYYSSITIAVKQYVYLPSCPCKCPHYTDTSLLWTVLCSNRGPPRNGLVHGRFDQNSLPATINTGTVSVLFLCFCCPCFHNSGDLQQRAR